MIKKLLYITFFIGTAGLIFSGLLFGSSQILAFFKTGADQSEMLLLSSEQLNDYYQPKVVWVSDHQAEGRKMSPGTRKKITSDYVAGHYYQFVSANDGRAQGLEDYFTKNARQKLVKLAGIQSSNAPQHSATTIEHLMTLKFYAEDGTLAVLNDQAITYNEFGQGNNIKMQYYDTSVYEVMLLLEDNFWRVRHKIRVNDPVQFNFSQKNEKEQLKIVGDQFIEPNGVRFRIKCMNYYPQENPWEAMWVNFDSSVVQTDFREIATLGFNSIRIFIPYEEFGAAVIKNEHVEKLNQLLDIAYANELRVIVTLFDFYLGYQLEQWTLADRHAEQLVSAIKNHPALLAWDIKNEPDLDFENFGENRVCSWLDFMGKRIRTYDPNHFITIGWSQPERAAILADEMDFISFHYYRPIAELKDINSSKPVMVGETGMHSFSALWYPFSKDQEQQAQYIHDILQVINTRNWSYGIWTLYDFPQVPSNVAGSAPWRKSPQKHMGLISVDGNKKKAYLTVMQQNMADRRMSVQSYNNISWVQ